MRTVVRLGCLLAICIVPDPRSVGIGAQQPTAENMVSGVPISQQLPHLLPAQPPATWEAHYLRTLITRCDPLDLAPFNPSHPPDLQPVSISDVFTTLYLERMLRRPDQLLAEAILHPHNLEQTGRPGRKGQEELLPIQAVEAVAALPRLAILGQVWEWTRSLRGEGGQKPEHGYPYDHTCRHCVHSEILRFAQDDNGEECYEDRIMSF